MKKVVCLLFFLAFFMSTPFVFAQNSEEESVEQETNVGLSDELTPLEEGIDDYTIGRGDVLEISIWKEEGLTKSVTIRPDGKASFPLIGEFRAAGLTVRQLTDSISEAFKKYFPDPIVSVTIEEMNSLQIHVIGRVKKPGRFPYTSKITIVQALAMAEGLTPFAEQKNIFVLRERNGHKIKLKFNYSEFVKGENLDQNIILERGDVVVVP